jgi:hypothetical protein
MLVAQAEARVFHGDYTVSYFAGPRHSETGSPCAVFTATGTIDDVQQRAGHDQSLRDRNRQGRARGFDRWFSGVGPLTPVDDRTIVIVKGCAGG